VGNTSIEQTSRSNTLVLEGLRNLKSASLFQIIAWILSLIAIVVFVVGWITAIIQSIKTFITFGAYPGGIFGGFIGLGLVVAELILSIIGITLSIISVFYLLSSVKKFVDWKPIDFSTPRKLLNWISLRRNNIIDRYSSRRGIVVYWNTITRFNNGCCFHSRWANISIRWLDRSNNTLLPFERRI